MLKVALLQAVIALAREVVERSMHHPRPLVPCDIDGAVLTPRVENEHVVGPRHGVEAVRDVDFLVQREDEDGDHVELHRSESSTRRSEVPVPLLHG